MEAFEARETPVESVASKRNRTPTPQDATTRSPDTSSLPHAPPYNPIDMISATGCTEFTIFNKLPPELRLKIWRFEFLRGRKVEVGVIQFGKDGPIAGHSWTPNPATLGVNQESRVETLKHYKGHFIGKAPRTHYFHPDVDTVFLKGIHDAENTDLGAIDPGSVKNLELYNVMWLGWLVLWPCLAHNTISWMRADFIADKFRNLEQLILVPGPYSLKNLRFLFSTPSVLKASYADVLDAFVRYKGDDPECKIPKIMIKGFPQEEVVIEKEDTTT